MAGYDYTCALCGGTFHTDWSESDALMEYQEVFSEEERAVGGEPPAILCDDCYRRVTAI
ncbi:MAG: hypothetical protein WDO73_03130 [Ignavibacteriota bacterium]